VFWICAENSAGSTGMLSVLLSSAYTAARPSLRLISSRQQGGLGVHKRLGGDTAGTADSI